MLHKFTLRNSEAKQNIAQKEFESKKDEAITFYFYTKSALWKHISLHALRKKRLLLTNRRN